MKRLVTLVTLFGLVILAPGVWAQGLPTAKPEAVGLSSERLERVSRVLRSEIEAGKIPGAVALVARKGQIVYFESLGVRDPATGEPMRKDAIFRLYSMTKPFASVAAMMLMEDGNLLLTDPVAKFLPQLAKREVSRVPARSGHRQGRRQQVPADRDMTIQDLLRHTSGLVYGSFTPNHADQGALREERRRLGATSPLRSRSSGSARCRSRISRARRGSTACPPTCSGASSRKCPAPAARSLSRRAGLRSAEDDRTRASWCRAPSSAGSRSRSPSSRAPVSRSSWSTSRCRRRTTPAARAARRPRPTTRASVQMLLNGGQLDGTRLLSPDHRGLHDLGSSRAHEDRPARRRRHRLRLRPRLRRPHDAGHRRDLGLGR